MRTTGQGILIDDGRWSVEYALISLLMVAGTGRNDHKMPMEYGEGIQN